MNSLIVPKDNFKMNVKFKEEKSKVYNKKIYHNEFKFAPEKTIANDLNNFSSILLDQIGCKVYELTCDFHPNQVDRQEAWESIKMREKVIVEHLKSNEDIVFILSGIEYHTGKKSSKLKISDAEENEEEVVEDDTEKNKFLYNITPEMLERNPNICEQLLYEIFVKYDENFKVIKVRDRNVDIKIVYERMYKHFSKLVKKTGVKIDRETFLTNLLNPKFINAIYEIFLDTYKESIYSTPYYKEGTLEGFPHIHFAIAVKNESLEFKTCSDIERFLKLQRYTPFYDVKVTRLSESGTPSTDTKKGKKATPFNTELDGPIFSYVLKNDRYYKTLQNLNKNDSENITNAVSLYNITKNSNVDRFFTFFTQYGISINNIEKRELTDEELKLMSKKINHRVSYHGELGITPLENFVMTSSSSIKSRQIKEIASYMEKHKFAFSFDGVIFHRVEGSVNTWRSHPTIKSADDLYYRVRSIGNNSDFFSDSFLEEFRKVSSNIHQNDYPKVFVDGLSIEYNDFYYYMPSNTVIKKNGKINQHYACVNFYPQISYEQLEKIKNLELVPDNYLYILKNSGYVGDDNKPKGPCGNSLIHYLWRYSSGYKIDKEANPVLIGQQNSAKSTVFEVLNRIHPENSILLLNDASDRFIFQNLATNRNITRIWADEIKDDRSISKETLLKIGNFGSQFSASIRKESDVQIYNSYLLGWASHTIERIRNPNVLTLLYGTENKNRFKIFHKAPVQLLKDIDSTIKPENNKECSIVKYEDKITQSQINENLAEHIIALKNSYKEELRNLKILQTFKTDDNTTGIYIYRHQRVICDDDKLTVEERNAELNRDLDQGLNARFRIFSFKTLKKIDPDGKDKCIAEAPLVVLYLGMINNKCSFNESSSILETNVLLNKYKEDNKDTPLLINSPDFQRFKHDGEFVRHRLRFYTPEPVC